MSVVDQLADKKDLFKIDISENKLFYSIKTMNLRDKYLANV